MLPAAHLAAEKYKDSQDGLPARYLNSPVVFIFQRKGSHI